MPENLSKSVEIRILKELKFSGGKFWLYHNGFLSYDLTAMGFFGCDLPARRYRFRRVFIDFDEGNLLRDRIEWKFDVKNEFQLLSPRFRRKTPLLYEINVRMSSFGRRWAVHESYPYMDSSWIYVVFHVYPQGHSYTDDSARISVGSWCDTIYGFKDILTNIRTDDAPSTRK